MQPTLRQDDFMERAMRTWGSTVYRLALNQTQSPHDAEDICQDVFLRLLKDATAFKDDEHLKAWLLCVAINRCRDLHRLLIAPFLLHRSTLHCYSVPWQTAT